MAEVTNSLCEFRMKRVPEGLEVRVQTSEDLEKVFASRSTRAMNRSAPTPYEYYNMGLEISDDNEVTHALFLVGSSKEGGAKIVLRTPRTKDQLQRIARKVDEWLRLFYEQHLRPIDIMVRVETRINRV